MRVKCRVKGLEFYVPCGDGEQTLKWLSLVAAQQYELRKPNGQTRCRERSNAARGFFLPMSVQSGKGESLRDPNAKINEVFNDGAEVTVELQESVEVDNIGAPALSDWQQKSFCVGEASQLRLKADMARKEEEKRQMLAKMAVENRKKFEMNIAITGSMDYMMSDVTLGATPAYDWSTIVEVISGSSQKDQDELEEYFVEVYGLLNDIFSNYAGEKKKDSGEPCTMSFVEFSHFLHMTRIYHAYKDLPTIKEFVLETKRRLMAASESKREEPSEEFLSREEFFAAVIHVAIEKAGGTKRSSGCVQELVEKYIEPHWTEGRAEDKIKSFLDSEKAQKLLTESWLYLKQVYTFYVQPTDNKVMTQECFGNVMKDAGLLMRNPGEKATVAEDRMDTLCLNAFFGTQGFPARQLELSELVFSEFIEAACRLSQETLHQQKQFDKWQLAVDALLDLRRNGMKA